MQKISVFIKVAAMASMFGSSSAADGIFFQHDTSKDSYATTISLRRDRLTISANAFKNDQDRALAFSIARSVELEPKYGKLRFGPAIRQSYEENEAKLTNLGVTVVYEKYLPTDFGAFFCLAEANSIDNTVILLGQASFSDPNLIVEIFYGRGDGYEDTSVALSKQLPGTDISGRLGYRIKEQEIFVGMSFNTF